MRDNNMCMAGTAMSETVTHAHAPDTDSLVKKLTREHNISPRQLAIITWQIGCTLSPTTVKVEDRDLWLRIFANLDLETQQVYVKDIHNTHPKSFFERVLGYVGR